MSVIERLKILVDKEKSQADFCRKCHITTAALSYMLLKGKDISSSILGNILVAYPTLSARWFLTGEGEMYRNGVRNVSIDTSPDKAANVRMWDTPAIAGWITFTNEGRIVREFHIPNLQRGQIYDALTVEGNSMTPEYNDGDIIIIKPCPMSEFRTDAVYLVALKDSAPVLKSVRLLPGKKELELNSFNPNIKPQRIEIEYVLSLYLVVAKIQRCG